MSTCTKTYGYCTIPGGFALVRGGEEYLVAEYTLDATGCTQFRKCDQNVRPGNLTFVPGWGFCGLGISNGYTGEAVEMIVAYGKFHRSHADQSPELRFFNLDGVPIEVDVSDPAKVREWLLGIRNQFPEHFLIRNTCDFHRWEYRPGGPASTPMCETNS